MSTLQTNNTSPQAQPLQYSNARSWKLVRTFVHDCLADSLHQLDALQGAQPCVNLLISRRCLPGVDHIQFEQDLERLSIELRRMEVQHAFHTVVPGDVEPFNHQLRITLRHWRESEI
jgi:hypothetical protein